MKIGSAWPGQARGAMDKGWGAQPIHPVRLLACPGLHEVYAASAADGCAAIGFVLGCIGGRLAGRGNGPRERSGAVPAPDAVCWVRQDWLGREAGRVNATGLAEFAVSADAVTLVCAKDVLGLLQAGLEAARCPDLAAALIEFQGEARLYDLIASRRLSRAAREAGLPLYVVRHAAKVCPSAAETRWQVRALPSRPLLANAPGLATFHVTLLRNRGGPAGQDWAMEWNRDKLGFDERPVRGATGQGADSAALSRAMVSVSCDRTAGPRRAG